MDSNSYFAALIERILIGAILLTLPAYFIGGLYIVAPVIAWICLGILVTGYRNPLHQQWSWTIIFWWLGMFAMLVSLLVAHEAQDLGMGKTIKSSVGWAKGWALMAIFVTLGYYVPIKMSSLSMAVNKVAIHCLWLTPVLIAAYLVGLPESLYVSPLKAVGGPGPEFFELRLYEIEPGVGTPRWRFFTPWAPACGFIGVLFAIIIWQQRERPLLRWLGILACVLMVLMSKSRLSLIALLLIPSIGIVLRYFSISVMSFCLAIICSLAIVLFEPALEMFMDLIEQIKAARADSTRVREALAEIAVYRWKTETPIWGHGIVELGSHYVEFMPIGSHHTWYGLLFIKGLVGFYALFIPMLMTLLVALKKSLGKEKNIHALQIILLFSLFTFGENLEILAYLFWPGLIVIGMMLRKYPTQESKSIQTKHSQKTIVYGLSMNGFTFSRNHLGNTVLPRLEYL